MKFRRHNTIGFIFLTHVPICKSQSTSRKTQTNTQKKYLKYLGRHELSLALLADLQKGVTRHVLHPRVVLVHKLEQFVHHSLQKLPVCAQKAGILTCEWEKKEVQGRQE